MCCRTEYLKHMKEGEFSSDVSFYRYNIELGNSEWYNHSEKNIYEVELCTV